MLFHKNLIPPPNGFQTFKRAATFELLSNPSVHFLTNGISFALLGVSNIAKASYKNWLVDGLISGRQSKKSYFLCHGCDNKSTQRLTPLINYVSLPSYLYYWDGDLLYNFLHRHCQFNTVKLLVKQSRGRCFYVCVCKSSLNWVLRDCKFAVNLVFLQSSETSQL